MTSAIGKNSSRRGAVTSPLYRRRISAKKNQRRQRGRLHLADANIVYYPKRNPAPPHIIAPYRVIVALIRAGDLRGGAIR
jgi:hypothetical protein